MEDTLVAGNPSRMMEAGEPQLDEIADLARQLVVLIDRLPRRAAVALELAGWDSGKTFAMRAELAHLIECADRTRRGAARATERR
jgi:hypothetical protein